MVETLRSRTIRLPPAGSGPTRSRSREALPQRRQYPFGQVRGLSGSRMTASPSRRIDSSSPSNRNSLGSRTAWLLPFRNNLAVPIFSTSLVDTSIDHRDSHHGISLRRRQDPPAPAASRGKLAPRTSFHPMHARAAPHPH